MLIACASGVMFLDSASSFKLSPTYTSHQKTHIIKSIMPKKSLIKKKYQKDLARSLKYIIQIIACVFLLGIVFIAIFKGGF